MFSFLSQNMLIAFAVKISPLPNCASIIEGHLYQDFEEIMT